MLVSHRKQFIFTKTGKTAGTSIESYFEKYCMPDGEWKESHFRDEYISEAGIIGYRGYDASGATWFNHMSAEELRGLIGQDIWDRYFKFTVVRNPFDKLISFFFWSDDNKYNRMQRIKAFAKQMILGTTNPFGQVKGKPEVERFRYWIRKGGKFIDRDKYLIDGEECVDYYVRFGNLQNDLRHVCEHLAIPFEPARIPVFKKGIRPHNIQIQDYYDDETRQIVENIYAWELKRFSYDLPK